MPWFGVKIGMFRFLYGFVVGVMLLSIETGAAMSQGKNDAFPLTLPVNENHAPIPVGRGLASFIGNWDDTARLANIRITPETMISTAKTGMSPIRVLAEAPNYVLLLKYVNTRMRPPWNREWSSFVILTYRGSGIDELGYHACNDTRMDDSKAPFEWPKAKIMEVFFSSDCFRKIKPTGDDPLRPVWGRWTYHRAKE